jgi:HK97 family phage portal protein
MRFWQRVLTAGKFVANGNGSIGSSRDLYQFLMGRDTLSESGVDVTTESAMRLSSVYSCVNVVSQDMAKLPLKVYKRIPKGKEEATEHWLTKLLRKPNPWQTGFEFREMLQAHVELSGNFFALKTVLRGQVIELLPIPPWRMQVEQQRDWSLKYTLQLPDGTSQIVPPSLVFHHRGLSLDGILGVSPIAYQRETVGLGISLTRYGSKLFKNGAMVGGVLEHPKELTDQAAARLKASFEEVYASLGNAHKTILLEEGMKFNRVGLAADDAQFLESRKFSRTEIAGFYRVPPHMIGDLERSTFSNIEQQSRDYTQNGLMPRAVRLEQKLCDSLLSPRDQDVYFVEHLMDGLLRGDFEGRMTGYQTAVLTGWMTRNQVRELENQNPGPAELDEYLVPLNLTEADQLALRAPKPAKPADSSKPGAPEDHNA